MLYYICVTTPLFGHPVEATSPFSSSFGIAQASLALHSLLRLNLIEGEL